jgi:hypothetical protein
MMAVFVLGANPAFRCNLFIFKGKIKRISTSIGAKTHSFSQFNLSKFVVFNSNKRHMMISIDVKKELDIRIKNLEERKAKLYTWEEVKDHLKSIRK